MVTDTSWGKTETGVNWSSAKTIKNRDMNMITPNQQTTSKNQQKKEKKNMPLETNGESIRNIPENASLQKKLSWISPLDGSPSSCAPPKYLLSQLASNSLFSNISQ